MSTPGKDIPLVNLNVPSIDPKKPLHKMLTPKTAFEKGYKARLEEVYKQAGITPVGPPAIPHNADISSAPLAVQQAANPYPPIKPVQPVAPSRSVDDMMRDRAIQQGTQTIQTLPQMKPQVPVNQAPKPMVQFPSTMQKHSSYVSGFVKRAAEYGFSQQEIAAIYKKAEGEDPTAQQAPAPEAAPQAPAQGGQAIPPELLAQLVQLLQQQQGGQAPQGGTEAPDQAKIMQYLQQAGGK